MPGARSPIVRPARLAGGRIRLLAWPLAAGALILPLLCALDLGAGRGHGGDGDDAVRAAIAAQNRASTAVFRWSNAGRLTILRPPAGRPSIEFRVPASDWAAFTPAERLAMHRNLSCAAIRGVAIERYVIRDDAGAVLAEGTGD